MSAVLWLASASSYAVVCLFKKQDGRVGPASPYKVAGLCLFNGLSMYKSFFRLTHDPFSITPNPHLFCPSPSHEEALAGLYYGVGS